MHRTNSTERQGWRDKAAAEGFVFHSPAGGRYWREDARYEFTLLEIERDIEAPTAEIDAMVLDIVPDLLADELYLLRLGFGRTHWDWIAESWRRRDPSWPSTWGPRWHCRPPPRCATGTSSSARRPVAWSRPVPRAAT